MGFLGQASEFQEAAAPSPPQTPRDGFQQRTAYVGATAILLGLMAAALWNAQHFRSGTLLPPAIWGPFWEQLGGNEQSCDAGQILFAVLQAGQLPGDAPAVYYPYVQLDREAQRMHQQSFITARTMWSGNYTVWSFN